MSEVASVVHEGEKNTKRKRVVIFGIDANTIPYMRVSLRNSLIALFSSSMGYFLFTSNLRKGVLVGSISFVGTYFGTSLYLGYRDYDRYRKYVQKIKNNEVLYTEGSIQLDDSD
ncbi:uncharacterized protein LOC128177467 [Crassostrea angulata]|uniref:uncharacterized protein LOC128177467 n=1 Tax=Magallana angulata TaxID=2784310 RepID=UPI0022B11097|nr:uncharacterized protein LOC128177467 [Crassostrea angulata]